MKGWRTVIFNAAAAVPPLVDAMAVAIPQLHGMRIFNDSEFWKWYCLGVVSLNTYLRSITTTAIGKAG